MKYVVEMRAGKSGSGLTRVIDSSSPFTRMPEMCGALPARYACTPTMSAVIARPKLVGSVMFGDSARSIE